MDDEGGWDETKYLDSDEIDSEVESELLSHLHHSKDLDTTVGKLDDSATDEWKVDAADTAAFVTPTRKRYYAPNSGVRCHNCNEYGHVMSSCSAKKKVFVCYLCCTGGHMAASCPDRLCFRCQLPGHIAADCTNKSASFRDSCHRCSLHGHFQQDCPDRWRQYHNTTGLSKTLAQVTPDCHPRYCYNCAKKGHGGYECPKPRMPYAYPPTMPVVARYDKLYKLHLHKHNKLEVEDQIATKSKNVRDDSSKVQVNRLERRKNETTRKHKKSTREREGETRREREMKGEKERERKRERIRQSPNNFEEVSATSMDWSSTPERPKLKRHDIVSIGSSGKKKIGKRRRHLDNGTYATVNGRTEGKDFTYRSMPIRQVWVAPQAGKRERKRNKKQTMKQLKHGVRIVQLK